MIPEINRRKLAYFIDVFCEKNYFDKDETVRVLTEGAMFGMIPKLHTDQFNSVGGIDEPSECNAISVDHLEVLKDKDIKKLAKYNDEDEKYMMASLLPGVSSFLDISYPPAKKANR